MSEATKNWKPIETAPRDGSPVWARGSDWGERNNDTHAGFVWWNGRAWVWAGHISNNLAIYVTEWLESRAALEAEKAERERQEPVAWAWDDAEDEIYQAWKGHRKDPSAAIGEGMIGEGME